MKNWLVKTLFLAAGIPILAASPCYGQIAIVPSSPPGIEFQTVRKRMQAIPLVMSNRA